MNFGITTNLESIIYQEALRIRREVFVIEQQIPESIEIDSLEKECLHIVQYNGDIPVATARLYPVDDTTWKIQRVAVKKEFRRQQMGRQLLEEIARLAEEKRIQTLTLNAQVESIGFYKALGYQTVGEPFTEASILHNQMKRFIIK
ncbi:GNAT family N-acetyltransferase [Vagococcus xieshaowenii]|uniref:GNAT family N-acetyltransferase n=1 Tax=Vagococcus xieshaowenii TaxID=2562451 RepID=A0AAJ5JM96_9ENTE|nr:GNAT family N-acetyltransferase [Vagococcus xieshaowenii]QCA29119.1 GNAT family N-acetyltransferase [Vagococcus xieshaowenii]TFZ40905.1 GNAT family N-acetyltransferase [Vagococcus xieshaowenii]